MGDTTPVEVMAVAFARLLRGADVDVPLGRLLTFVESLDRLGVSDRRSVYWSARTTLLSRPEDQEIFDRAFASFWEGVTPAVSEPAVHSVQLLLDDPDADVGEDVGEDEDGDHDGELQAVRFSRVEVLSKKDFAECTDEEMAELAELFDQLAISAARRKSRRLVRGRQKRGRPDLERTARLAMRTGGEPIRRYFREPDTRPRRLVLLVDISGSMEPYARGLLRFAHAAVAGRARVEAFTFGTRLTRVTRELASRDPDRALARASESVEDWSGGTRIGESLRRFNDEWGVRGTARGALVVILSDGWDRGEPDELAAEMARLKRVAYRIVWVNPLKHTPGYAPLARGMAAALPYVDEFMEGHSLDSLRDLASAVAA